jgi:ubiquinol-cytochrome c reductase cytochrome b subunit
MVNVLAVIIALGAVLNLIKGHGKSKVVGVVIAAVVIALLKTFEAKFWGVAVMGGAVVILVGLPWFDKSPVKSIRYRPSWHKLVYGVFVINFVILGYLGVQPPSPTGEMVSPSRHADVLRLLRADAVVEPVGYVQASA